jgi:hypothetical protein
MLATLPPSEDLGGKSGGEEIAPDFTTEPQALAAGFSSRSVSLKDTDESEDLYTRGRWSAAIQPKLLGGPPLQLVDEVDQKHEPRRGRLLFHDRK